MGKSSLQYFGIFSVLLVSTLASEKVSYRGDQVFRLFPVTQAHSDFLDQLQHSSQFDFWSHVPASGNHPVNIRVAKDTINQFLALLNNTKIPHTLTVADVQTLIDSVDEQNHVRRVARSADERVSVVGRYGTYAEITAWIKEMSDKYPKLASWKSYGKSSENRDLLYMKIGNAPAGSKNGIFIETGMHAREWIHAATTIYTFNELLTKYDTDPMAKQMLDKHNFYVSFLGNPDGYEYSRTKERLWRKTRSKTSSASCFGVDPNRNWDAYWATVGSSNSPCSDTYHGPSVFSEPETKTISDLVLSLKGELMGYFAVHSFSQYWMLPYGYKANTRPSDYNELLRVANIGAKALMAVNNKKWVVGNSADILYACAGASDDWAKMKAGIKYVYTIELRPASGTLNGFVLLDTYIVPSGREFYAGLVAAVDAMSP